MTIKRYRRYLLLKRRGLYEIDPLDVMPAVFQAKQESQPGTPLPAAFPVATKLATAGYTTVDDIDGADVSELQRAGLTSREAEAVLVAVSALTPAVP